MIELRTTAAGERETVLKLVKAAFDPGDEEVELVQSVWSSSAYLPDLDLVAVVNGEIVGHILLSRATVADHTVTALAPVAVLPAHQRQGVGSALVEDALRLADDAGFPMVVLLGHPEYYPRFGFVEAMTLGLTYQDRDAPFLPFMARTLGKYVPEIRGEFRFAWESA